ncbi:MAG TPA: helix-turn-helix domain-containing protein [Gammaproteobacteria bacterium]|nr:helix-turn-helix domain-containing protein [Gammaproteobacteria bacterium]
MDTELIDKGQESRLRTPAARPLNILGISEAEERTYRWLLIHSGAIAQDLAQDLSISPRKAQRLLDTIESKGLATHSPERPRRYIPAAPDIALEALILQRQKDLQDVRTAVHELQNQAVAQQHGEQEQIIELLTSREAERQVFEHMQHVVQREVLSLIRAPVRVTRLDAPDDVEMQQAARARGVCYRSIVDSQYLGLPGAVRRTWEDIRRGEVVRVVPHLPFKMILADRRIALMPLNVDQSSDHVLLVRSSALLDALYALFEILWERAAPVSFNRAGDMEAADPGALLPMGAEALVSLMAAGLNDKAIAYQLGISIRTLERRVVELMGGLNARTRFQMGWLAALRAATGKIEADI